MGFLKVAPGLGDDLGVGLGEVVLLGEVALDVVELDLGVGVVAQAVADGLPFAHPERALAARFVEFPVEVVVLLLGAAAGHGRHHAQAVDVVRSRHAGEVAERRQQVPVRRDVVVDGSLRDLTGPPRQERHPDATVVEAALVPRERSVAVPEPRVVAALEVGAVVRGQHDEGVVVEVEFLQEREQLADVVVHLGHHRGEPGDRIDDLRLASIAAILADLVVELWILRAEALVIFRRRLHGGVRDRDGQVAEERALAVGFDEGQRVVEADRVRVLLAVELEPVAVAPQPARVEVVREPLAIEAGEVVEAERQRVA